MGKILFRVNANMIACLYDTFITFITHRSFISFSKYPTQLIQHTFIMKTLQGKTRTAFLFFFGSHIPATLCIDLQALFPNIYPTPLQNLLSFYTSTFNDQLMAAPHDTWFRAIIAGEFVFQLPFFFLMVHALLNSEKYDGKGWFKNLCLVYG